MLKSLALALILAAGSTVARADPVTASTSSALSFRTCVAGVTACDAIGPPFTILYRGSPGAASFDTAEAMPGFGSALAFLSLSGTIGAPVMLANASSESGARVNTTSLALQSYTYTGAVASTRTFGSTLTYSQALTGIYPGPNGNGIFASINLFTLPSSTVEVGSTAESNFAALAGIDSLPGFTDRGSQVFEDTTLSVVNGFASLAVTVTLQPGETIWVLALLQTPALNGSVVDASHTLITAWNDPTNLTPGLVAAVPEPSTSALLGLGLAGLAWFGRRSKAGRRPEPTRRVG